jgi:hypothetical protein
MARRPSMARGRRSLSLAPGFPRVCAQHPEQGGASHNAPPLRPTTERRGAQTAPPRLPGWGGGPGRVHTHVSQARAQCPSRVGACQSRLAPLPRVGCHVGCHVGCPHVGCAEGLGHPPSATLVPPHLRKRWGSVSGQAAFLHSRPRILFNSIHTCVGGPRRGHGRVQEQRLAAARAEGVGQARHGHLCRGGRV